MPKVKPKPKPKPKPRQARIEFFMNTSPKKTSPRKQTSSSNGLRQATIQSLSRVVNVDHILRCKAMLKDPHTEKEVMISTLEELNEKIPSREVLQNTEIGHVIRKLAKHEDPDIAKHSKRIYHKWKNFFVDQATKTPIDVKCSVSTENCRRNGRRHLADTLEVSADHPRVAEFEREAFHLCKTLTLNQYKRIMRAIILKSRNDHNLRESILLNTKKTSEIVKMFQ